MAEANDAPALARFFADAAEWWGRLQTPRPEICKTVEFWRAEADRLQEVFRADIGCQMFLFSAEDPGRIEGHVHLFTFVRGAFQACTCGYALREDAEGKGLMTEGLRAAVEFAFGPLNMHRIMANVRPDNARSLRLLERLGFQREGFAPRYLLQNGEWRDHILTALTNDAWTLTDD